MLTDWKKKRSFETESFDMTPVIDVVFLLIIFFMLVCQFIAAEQFQVQVPDDIHSARQDASENDSPLTITIVANQNDENSSAVYAIGTEKLGKMQGADLAQLIRTEIDRYLSEHEGVVKTVRLRCDKTITFGQVKFVLSGISKSTAATLDWAVLGE